MKGCPFAVSATHYSKYFRNLGLSGDMEQFLDSLSSEDSYELLKLSEISILIENGIIFFHNANSGESIFDFFAAQQDYNKKLLLIELSCSEAYNMF